LDEEEGEGDVGEGVLVEVEEEARA